MKWKTNPPKISSTITIINKVVCVALISVIFSRKFIHSEQLVLIPKEALLPRGLRVYNTWWFWLWHDNKKHSRGGRAHALKVGWPGVGALLPGPGRLWVRGCAVWLVSSPVQIWRATPPSVGGGGAVVKFRSEKVEGELLVGSVGAEPELFLGWMWRFWVCTHRSVVLCGAQYSGSTGSYGCFLVFLLVFVVFFPDYKINTYLVEKAWKLNMDVQKKKEITHKSNKT